MSYKELHTRYTNCIINFVEAINKIQSESNTYVMLGNEDLEMTAYGDITKHYTHSISVNDIVLQ